MIERIILQLGALRAALRRRANLVAEDLLLRQQLAVLAQATRKRPRLRARDKLFSGQPQQRVGKRPIGARA